MSDEPSVLRFAETATDPGPPLTPDTLSDALRAVAWQHRLAHYMQGEEIMCQMIHGREMTDDERADVREKTIASMERVYGPRPGVLE